MKIMVLAVDNLRFGRILDGNMSDISELSDPDDILRIRIDISEVIRVKTPSLHPDVFHLSVQSIDPF